MLILIGAKQQCIYQWGYPRLQCVPGILSKSRQFGTSQSPALAQSTGPLSSSIAFNYFLFWSLKAHTHRPIFRGIIAELAVESADSIPESADSTTDFTIVGRLSVSNMFNISTPTQSAFFSRPTIAVGGLQIGLVGMGL